jgi:hypothetical protein
MEQSKNIEHLATALSQFQGEVTDASTNCKVEYKQTKYRYADLTQILEIARPLLHKHNLAITQFPGSAGEKVTVKTVLMHGSGQWMSGTIEMPVRILTTAEGKTIPPTPQDIGSIITYARRYSYAAIIGITQYDDDALQGKEGMNMGNQKPVYNAPVQKIDHKKEGQSYQPSYSGQQLKEKVLLVSTHEINNLKELLKDDPERLQRLLAWAKIKTLEEMSIESYQKTIDHLRLEQLKKEKEEDLIKAG